MSTFYVVRHKPTGRVLPARVQATHWEFDREHTSGPRLFASARAARNCATCWALGFWTQQQRTASDGWEMPSYTYLAEAAPTEVPGRAVGDLEVVEVQVAGL